MRKRKTPETIFSCLYYNLNFENSTKIVIKMNLNDKYNILKKIGEYPGNVYLCEEINSNKKYVNIYIIFIHTGNLDYLMKSFKMVCGYPNIRINTIERFLN
jgi:hypothetical protein